MAESKSTKLYNFFDYIDDSRTIHDKFKRLHNGYSEPNEVRVYQSLDSKRCFVAVKSEVIFLGYKKPNFNFYSLALMSDIPKEGYNDAPLFNLHNEFDYKFGYGYDCLDVLARDEKDEKERIIYIDILTVKFYRDMTEVISIMIIFQQRYYLIQLKIYPDLLIYKQPL